MGSQQIYFNEKELRLLLDASSKADISLNDYIKNSALEKAKKETGGVNHEVE